MSVVPPVTSRLWDDLVTGKRTHKFELFAANMAVSRCARIVAAEPHWRAAMISELHLFFLKFEKITAADLAHLTLDGTR